MAAAPYTIGNTEREASAVTDCPETGQTAKQEKLLTADEIERARRLITTDMRQDNDWRANAMCDAALRTIAAEARLKEFEGRGNLESSRYGGRNSIYSIPYKRAEFSFSSVQSMYWTYED